MEKKVSIKTLYLLLVISIGLVGLGIGSTYAIFTTTAEIDNPIALKSELSYTGDIIETIEVEVPAGEMVTSTLNVTNSSDSTLNYAAWYLDEGYDISVIAYSGEPQGTLTSAGSVSITVNIKNKGNSSVNVLLGISSNTNSIILSNNMKMVEDVNFLMSVTANQTPSTNFLNSSLTRKQISSITFVDNNSVPSGYFSVDVSRDGDGSILLWYSSANSDGYYDIYIGSNKGKIYIGSGYYLFSYLYASSIKFNGLIDTSRVTNMQHMFGAMGASISASAFELDLSDFDTSSVITMEGMFAVFQRNATNFSLDLSNFDTSNVTTMYNMFALAGDSSTSFELILDNWNTANVTNMNSMFLQTGAADTDWTLDLSDWVVTNVTDSTDFSSGAGGTIVAPNFE